MHRLFFGLCFICSTAVVADLLGASYPPPTDLSSDQSLVTASWNNASQTLLDSISVTSNTSFVTGIQNLTFSLGMFSLFDDNATALQFHHTSAEVKNSPNGTHNVDADSIYRIASITKVFTVLAGLLELSRTDWETPLSELIPTLAQFVQQTAGTQDPINLVAWDRITPSSLAAQIAGVPRDAFPAPGELTTLILYGDYTFADFPPLGFPPIADNDTREFQPCFPFLNGTSCPSGLYIEGVEASPPTFLPWTTPAYSDAGFSMLGLAIESIAGRSMEEVYLSDIFEPLNMASSNSSTPPESEWYRCVIPGDLTDFAYDAGVSVSSGGLSSTTTDLARFGRAILNSTLLRPEDTRRWLKPISHTAHLQYSVGSPWEIMRYTHPDTGKVTDVYTKLGDSGKYSGFLVLIPDYGAGFSILSSGTATDGVGTVEEIVDVIIDAVLPALEAQAAAEAECNLGGVYKSTDATVNSSISLSLNQSAGAAPGLHITSWISNGTDLLHSGVKLLENVLGPQPLRLVPSIQDVSGRQSSFWVVNANDAPNAPVGAGRLVSAPGSSYADWVSVDSPAYGGLAIKRLVFNLTDDGKATALSPTAFRIVLAREHE